MKNKDVRNCEETNSAIKQCRYKLLLVHRARSKIFIRENSMLPPQYAPRFRGNDIPETLHCPSDFIWRSPNSERSRKIHLVTLEKMCTTTFCPMSRGCM